MYKKIILSVLTLCMVVASYAQEDNKEGAEGIKRHKLALVFGYTHIPAAFIDGHSKSSVYAPTIGFDYFYTFANRWSIGGVIDLEFANYIVDFNKEELERERPVVTGIFVGYEKLIIEKNKLAKTVTDLNTNQTRIQKTYYPFMLYNYV